MIAANALPVDSSNVEQLALSRLADLADAGTSGSFFWAVTMFGVGGVRHSPNSATRAAKEEDQ